MSRLLLQLSHVYLSFGPLALFRDISVSIHAGERFALIGENGIGKTTLFKLIMNYIESDSGQIDRSSHLTISYLAQEISHPPINVRTYLENTFEQQMEEALASGNIKEWERLYEQFEQQGGYKRLPLEKVVKGLHIDIPLDTEMSTLSSGQKIRVALAKVLVENPDILLLDEPTNHLDQTTLSWLEETLLERKGATIIVSHDRKFLNKTCNRLIELENGSLTWYGGNYDFYLQEKERLIERQEKAYEAQAEEKKAIKQQIKAMSFAKRKPSPPSDSNTMAYDKRGEKHQKSLQRNLNVLKSRLAEIEENPLLHPRPKGIGLYFRPAPINSRVVLICEEVSKSFGSRTLFSHLNKILYTNDRIILRGANGSGKTTLLKCIMGFELPDTGTIRLGSGVKIAYLDQEVALLPMDQTPLSYFGKKFNLSETKIRNELHKAALGHAELLNRPFLSMSVGQRKRLMILSLLIERPNLLILDEPTNHLDFSTLEAFEQALLKFQGAILAVSHDTTFIEKIATDEWWLSVE